MPKHSNCTESHLWIVISHRHMNFCMAKSQEHFCLQQMKALQSQHPENEHHQEANERRQRKQQFFYNKHASHDKEVLCNNGPVSVRNTIKRIWEPGTIIRRPDPMNEPRTYSVEIGGKVYQRTREHLKPRTAVTSDVDPPGSHHLTNLAIPTFSDEVDQHQSPSSPLVNVPSSQETTMDMEHSPSVPPALQSNNGSGFRLRSQTTMAGRTTTIPTKFKD